MSRMPPNNQLDFFQNYYAHERFHAVIQFYSGIISVQSIETVSFLYDTMISSFSVYNGCYLIYVLKEPKYQKEVPKYLFPN